MPQEVWIHAPQADDPVGLVGGHGHQFQPVACPVRTKVNRRLTSVIPSAGAAERSVTARTASGDVAVRLDDIAVVDTPDALLMTTRARAQDVKLVVDALKA